jgi:predicted O-methyltransferase YrrM
VADAATEALRAGNARMAADPRVAASMVAVGDGMMLCTKL